MATCAPTLPCVEAIGKARQGELTQVPSEAPNLPIREPYLALKDPSPISVTNQGVTLAPLSSCASTGHLRR